MSELPILGTIEYEIIGNSKELPPNQLPTAGDVLRHIFYLREYGKTAKNSKLSDFKDILQPIISDVRRLWTKASIPQIIEELSLRKKLKTLFERYLKVKRLAQLKRFNSESVKSFVIECNSLFDICTCKCSPSEVSEMRGKLLCVLPRERNATYC